MQFSFGILLKKIMNGSSKIVAIAANVLIMKGVLLCCHLMQEVGNKTQTKDSIRICRAEQEAAKESREGRIRHGQEQKEALDISA